jgi:hypothetical protein
MRPPRGVMTVRKVLALLVLSSTLLIGSPAYAAPESAVVKLDKNATLAEGGGSATLTGSVVCPEGFNVLEAFVSLSQEGVNTSFGSLSVACTDRKVEFTTTVQVINGTLQAGAATASPFLLVLDPDTGQTLSDSPSASVRLRF